MLRMPFSAAPARLALAFVLVLGALVPLLRGATCGFVPATAASPAGPAGGEPGPGGFAAEEQTAGGLAEQIERMRSYAWREAWYERLDVLLDPPDARWAPCPDGWIPGRAVRFQLDWNRPVQKGGSLPRALDFELAKHPYAVIVKLHEQLAAHGIELVLAPVPTRLQVYPELVFGETMPESFSPLGDDFRGLGLGSMQLLAALEAAGVTVVDLLGPLAGERVAEGIPEGHSDQAFLRYNMHWTPHAARRAAQLVAERVRGLENFADTPVGTLLEGRDFVRSSVSGTWIPAGSRNSPPDTVAETLWLEQLRAPGEADPEGSAGSAPSPGGSLAYRSLASPILLLSDSYGTHFSVEHASFGEHLAVELGQKLDHIGIQGSGVLQTRRSVARREEHGVPTKKIVVWLFSVVMYVDENSWVDVPFFE